MYIVYSQTKNQKIASLTHKVCEQLQQFLNTGKYRTFAYAVETYAKSTKKWNIRYEMDTPIEGFLYISYEGITHHLRFEIAP